MILDHCFTEEWLESFKKQPNHSKIDKIVLEKMVYALYLLERLKAKKLTIQIVLLDTLNTCCIITKRGRGSANENNRFIELQKGIKAFGTGFLMSGNFRIDDAVVSAAKVAYLTAKILTNDLSPLEQYQGQTINDWTIEEPAWNFLNRLKKQPDKSGFFYWFQAVQLLKTINLFPCNLINLEK